MLLNKFLTIIVLLAFTGVGSTIPLNTTLDILPINLDSLSADCKSELFKIVINPEFLTCIPIPAIAQLLPIIPEIENIKKNPKEILNFLDQIDQFSNDICSAPKCSDDFVQSSINDIKDQCSTDLAGNNTIAEVIFGIAVLYSPLRDSICFKNNNTFCIHETLNITLNLPDSPFNITGNTIIDAIAVADPGQVCTQCNKDIINTFGNFLKNNTLALQVLAQAGINQARIDTMKIGVAVKCGINFEDGETCNNSSQ
ncbi:hypothetical protein C2G38_2181419 [Gigaspora rosea]|uniref:DUF7729 domain-containing protein n=1 Tax=Gigaspora rosea TaxID=44941 RepID=A0A397VCR1_9GLOM|nr:hypothetical protein C2G38_2181419 [Gigaspora rosea]CAG8611631.1 19742_t:CDS:2 [Gigaspora rosea]